MSFTYRDKIIVKLTNSEAKDLITRKNLHSHLKNLNLFKIWELCLNFQSGDQVQISSQYGPQSIDSPQLYLIGYYTYTKTFNALEDDQDEN